MRRLAALLLVAGCHGGLSPQAYPGELARAICASQVECRKQAAWHEADCEEEIVSGLMPDLGKAIAAGRVRFDEQSAEACLAGYSGRGCERQSVETDIACSKALTGAVTQGSPCNWAFECAGTYCEPQKNGACPGTCGAAIQRGGPCGDSLQCDRAQGLRCIASVCSPLHAAGEECSSGSDCRPELYCDANAGKCVARANELVVCDDDAQCAPGLYCRRTTAGGLCEKQAARGAPCGQDADHAESAKAQCGLGLVCAGFRLQKGAPAPGTCTTAGQMGDSCAADADVTGCAEGLLCTAGRCALAPATGPCKTNDDCEPESHYCDAGTLTCKEVKGTGEPCAAQFECQSRFCDGATGTCAEAATLACHEP